MYWVIVNQWTIDCSMRQKIAIFGLLNPRIRGSNKDLPVLDFKVWMKREIDLANSMKAPATSFHSSKKNESIDSTGIRFQNIYLEAYL